MAQAKSDYIIEVIGVDKAGAVMASVAQHQDSITASTVRATAAAEKQSGIISTLKSNWLAIGASVFAATRVIGSLVDHLKEGGRALALDQQIGALAGAAEKVEALRAGVRSTIDTTSLQQHVILLDRLGLSAQQASDVGLFALAEANRRGADTGQILERVVAALATGEVGSLKALGLTAKTAADAMVQMRDAGQSAATTLDGNVTVAIQQADAAWKNLVSDIEVNGARTFSALVDVTQVFSDQLRGFYAWRRTEVIAEDARRQAEIRLAEEWAEANRDLAESLGADLRSALGVVRDELGEWAPVTLAAASANDAFTASMRRMERVVAAVGGADALRAILEAGAGAAIGNAAGGIRVPRGGGGRGGGGRERGPAGGPDRSIAGIFGFAGAEADFLGGLSQETLGGAQTTGGRGNQGNFAYAMSGNSAPMVDQSTQMMLDFAETMGEVANDLDSSFGSIGDGFSGMLRLLSDSGAISKTGAVAKALAAVQITAIVAQAGVKMAFEIAEGLRTSVTAPWESASHFAAAAAYGVVAATNVAGVVAGVTGGRGSAAGAGQDPGSVTPSGADRERRQSGPTVIVINGPDADYSRSTMRALNQAAARGERIPVDLLSAEVRRQLDRAGRAA